MIVRMALVGQNNVVQNVVLVVEAEAPVIFPGMLAYVVLGDSIPAAPGWVWTGGTTFTDPGVEMPRPLVMIDDPPVNGRVLVRRWWQNYDSVQAYNPGVNPSGLAKREDYVWKANKVLSKTTTEYDGEGNVRSTSTTVYSTTKSGAEVVEGG